MEAEPETEPVMDDIVPEQEMKAIENSSKDERTVQNDEKITQQSTVESIDNLSMENVQDNHVIQVPSPAPLPLPPPPPLPTISLPPQSATPPPLPPLLPPAHPDLLMLDDDTMHTDIIGDQKEENAIEEMLQDNMEVDKTQDNDDGLSAMDDLDNDIPDNLYSIDDLVEVDAQTDEMKDGADVDGEHKLIRARPVNTTELGCCEYCGGPVKKRRISSPLKKFCSKACARNFRKAKREDEGDAQSEDVVSGGSSGATINEGDHKMTWDDYLQAASNKAAPETCFKHITTDVPGLKPGMKLEAVDRNNPPSYCVATVIKCVGHRVCIRYDGYGSDSTNDMWCNYQAEELHPIGWCAQNGYPLQPPKGVNSSLEAWRTFLTQTLTGALAAPQDLFKKSQEHFQPRVHGFEVGMKLEAIHPLRPSIICPATVTKSLGPYYFAVTPDYQHDLPPTTFCCHSDSPGIFPIGWCYRNGIELTYPANYSKKTFSWPKYLSICRATAAPSQLFKKVKAHKFRVGMKVEAVDLEQPAVICVATITNVIGRLLFLFFDGQSRFQFVDVESPDIYTIGWCKRTGHPLVTPFGVMPSNYDSKTKVAETEILYLPSFDEVMGRQAPTMPSSALTILPRKPSTRNEPDKEKEKEKEKDDQKGGMESEEKSGDSDISEDDCLASERFYHNKNQIFFNKGCCIGPLLNPEQVKLLPDATPPGKVSTVIRTGLEMVAQAALDPEKVIDLMQEGCGVRVTIKHQGKLLKKAISRVDSRPKLERYLKRFCRRLICCEYFLSLKPVGQPCPDQCKSDDQGNLQGPKGLKAKRSREYFEVKHLGFEKKKRGRRRRKTEILGIGPSQQGAVMKTASSENGTPVPATSVLPSTVRNRQLAPAYHIQPNGSTVNRPAVATAALPGVQAPVVRYQGPGNVAVVRPNTNLQLPVRPHGNPAIAPAQTPQLVIGSLHANAPIAKQDGLLANGRTLIMTSSGTTKPRIVTNVSSQRFATSSSGGGTTITFGRAPPNVTVCSSLTPPPLTRISDTVESISAELGSGNAAIAPSPKSIVGNFNLAPSSHLNSSRGPPNVVVSSVSQAMAMSGGIAQVSESTSSQYTSGGNTVGGVVRAPIVIPPQVKQETPPPPPLVHASKVSSGVRMVGPGTVVASTKVSLAPSSFSQVRSFSQRSFTSPNGQPMYKLASNTLNSQSPPKRTVFIRPGNVKSDNSISTSHKHIMSSYASLSPRISPKPPSMNQGGAGNESSKVTITRHSTPMFQTLGQKTRPIIPAKRQAIQTIHHNPSSSQETTSFPSHTVSTAVKPSQTVQSGTLEKVRAGIKSKSIHLEHKVNNKDTHLIKLEKNKDSHYAGMDHEKPDEDEHFEQMIGEAPKTKRNLWWLNKKRRRKRSRLTYMKPSKCRKNEDGNEAVSDEFYLSEDDMEDPALLEEYLDYPDRPKRGRINELNDFVMRLEDEEVLGMADEQDPDWDESMEGKKVKPQVKPKRKGFGRPRKDGGSELSSPTLSNPPSPLLPSPSNTQNSSYARRTNIKQLLPTDSKSHVIKLEPAPPRRPLSVSIDNDDGVSFKGKHVQSTSYSTGDGYSSRQPFKSTSSHASPISPKSPSLKRRRLVDVGVNTSLPGCVNGRSPDLPSNPLSWSVDQVIRYVRSTDCGHYAVIFKEEEIDGQALLMLSRDALMQFTPMKLGPTLKMCSYISQLRLRAK